MAARRVLERCSDCGRQVMTLTGPGGRLITLDCLAKVFFIERISGGYNAIPVGQTMVEHQAVCTAARRRRSA